jgi:hypothetical protein
MKHEHLVEITVTLTDAQAWQFAQFLKRACFSDYCRASRQLGQIA